MASTTYEAALDLLSTRPLVALTGAGVSTDSGIPDYRGPHSPARMPMTYQEFVSGRSAQQRYWARSHIGWSRMRQALPNAGHRALARLERDGHAQTLVTQNVDGLHEAAGSSRMVALHGRISDVVCLGCRRRSSRRALHERLSLLNAAWESTHRDAVVRPDGDVELDDTAAFRVPSCEACDGVLKPDVVFFGENVPRERVQRCFDAVDAADALLVAGSSLAVMSGFRFARHAHRRGLPIVIVNRGATRADDLATYKVEHGCSDFLTDLSSRCAVPLPGQEMSRRTENIAPSAANTKAYAVSTSPPAHQPR